MDVRGAATATPRLRPVPAHQLNIPAYAHTPATAAACPPVHTAAALTPVPYGGVRGVAAGTGTENASLEFWRPAPAAAPAGHDVASRARASMRTPSAATRRSASAGHVQVPGGATTPPGAPAADDPLGTPSPADGRLSLSELMNSPPPLDAAQRPRTRVAPPSARKAAAAAMVTPAVVRRAQPSSDALLAEYLHGMGAAAGTPMTPQDLGMEAVAAHAAPRGGQHAACAAPAAPVTCSTEAGAATPVGTPAPGARALESLNRLRVGPRSATRSATRALSADAALRTPGVESVAEQAPDVHACPASVSATTHDAAPVVVPFCANARASPGATPLEVTSVGVVAQPDAGMRAPVPLHPRARPPIHTPAAAAGSGTPQPGAMTPACTTPGLSTPSAHRQRADGTPHVPLSAASLATRDEGVASTPRAVVVGPRSAVAGRSSIAPGSAAGTTPARSATPVPCINTPNTMPSARPGVDTPAWTSSAGAVADTAAAAQHAHTPVDAHAGQTNDHVFTLPLSATQPLGLCFRMTGGPGQPIVVLAVDSAGPAFAAGIRPGMQLLRIATHDLSDVTQARLQKGLAKLQLSAGDVPVATEFLMRLPRSEGATRA
ncbi:hypothetical protein EON68_00455 [archaeon]|nr:MAG: hypothetical protein EON68_00455 [archaeon]